jgi:hypothetical protein
LYFEDIPIGFFDGVEDNLHCGAGMILKINHHHFFRLNMYAGIGTNTREELLALWGLLFFSMFQKYC